MTNMFVISIARKQFDKSDWHNFEINLKIHVGVGLLKL